MKKNIVTIVAFMLFALAGFAQGNGERVYIRVFNLNGAAGKTEIAIYEKGTSKVLVIENALAKKEESIKSFGDIMEKYFSQGYKLLSTATLAGGYSTEYILEKQ